jgi:hypothetical protein
VTSRPWPRPCAAPCWRCPAGSPAPPGSDAAPTRRLALGALVHHGARAAPLHPRPRRLTPPRPEPPLGRRWPASACPTHPSLPPRHPPRPAPAFRPRSPRPHHHLTRPHRSAGHHQPARSTHPKPETVDPGSDGGLDAVARLRPANHATLAPSVQPSRAATPRHVDA